jgi:hypothetical protein
MITARLKVHKHEIILFFLLPKSNSYMPLVNFREKNFASYPSIFARISKVTFFKKFTLVLFDGFLNGFSTFWFFIVEICILIGGFGVIFEN